jgi:Predicted AAA-ATPase/PD-(D/E)XK nuclease superfamily
LFEVGFLLVNVVKYWLRQKKAYICAMKKRILSLSRQNYRDLRESNCIYVDKTEHIYKMCTEGKMYFLSRPRRFGKSLLLSTLSELFQGSQELFEDTWINDKWDWTKKNPILHISFNLVDYEEYGLKEGLRRTLMNFYKHYALTPPEDQSIKVLFADLLAQIHEKEGKVVILIDEYDKPIIDHLEFDEIDKAKANQKILALFYGALKDNDHLIRLMVITGVSKFTRVSLFSKLNNLEDLTIHPEYTKMLGYTQQELESNFAEYIEEALKAFPHYSRTELLDKIRLWYNGYSWDGITKLYNPFGILLFLSSRDFQGFWFQSGTPSFLAKKMINESFFRADDIEANTSFLDQYSLDNIEITSLMFQTGYLTIKEKAEDGDLLLTYPNQEVRRAMYSFLMDNMTPVRGGNGVSVLHLKKAFLANDLAKVEGILVSMFGSLAFDVYTHQTQQQVEGFYHGLIHILFKYLGLYIQSEVHSLKGRADSIVQTPTHIYIFEFKINSDAQTAYQQIIDKQYALPYGADNRIKVGIGVNFNTATRQLEGWQNDVL